MKTFHNLVGVNQMPMVHRDGQYSVASEPKPKPAKESNEQGYEGSEPTPVKEIPHKAPKTIKRERPGVGVGPVQKDTPKNKGGRPKILVAKKPRKEWPEGRPERADVDMNFLGAGTTGNLSGRRGTLDVEFELTGKEKVERWKSRGAEWKARTPVQRVKNREKEMRKRFESVNPDALLAIQLSKTEKRLVAKIEDAYQSGKQKTKKRELGASAVPQLNTKRVHVVSKTLCSELFLVTFKWIALNFDR